MPCPMPHPARRRKQASSSKTEAPAVSAGVRTLAVDIGGSGVKTMVLDAAGKPLTDRLRAKTPNPSNPKAIIAIISGFAKELGDFDRVSVGFPGVIKHGVVYTAANLDKKWIEYDFAANLSKELGKPVRVANDAVVQGLGAVTRHGGGAGDYLGHGDGRGALSRRPPDPVAGDGTSPISQWQDLRG